MRTILITLDSLNRHFLSLYGVGEEHEDHIPTPNINSLAADGAVFENHFTGSAPCMPARRELLTGMLELKHRGWGTLEPFDNPLARRLKNVDCPSMLITDHYHLFEDGGENFHCDFSGYELIRGHENDNWKTFPTPKPQLNPNTHTSDKQEQNRLSYTGANDREENYLSARTLRTAVEWVEENRDTPDFFLYIDEFDPHEPFMAPERLLEQFDDSGYEGDRLEWPNYGPWKGTDQELRHVRNRYRAKVAFLDELLGTFLEALKKNGLYEETTIILTTDHGHFLGEHGWCGKPQCNNYNTLFHIPMVIKPAASLEAPVDVRYPALTTAADVFATVCDLHGISLDGSAGEEKPSDAKHPHGPSMIDDRKLYGRSFLPVLKGEKEKSRDYVLYGYFGKQLGYCDGEHTYLKSPASAANQPLNCYTMQFSHHPCRTGGFRHMIRQSEGLELGRHIEGVDFPVLKIPCDPEEGDFNSKNQGTDLLFSHADDLEQKQPLDDSALEKRYREKLAAAMKENDFPPEQFERLGLQSA